MGRRLLIVTGPTAVGKTGYAIDLALRYGSPILNCDSRQIYREMTIGTAVPSPEELAAVRHYFIQTHSVRQLYTAGMYEVEALALIEELFAQGHETLVMCGGSGFYIDAVCKGLDAVPPADEGLRTALSERLATEGLESLRMELRRVDPAAWASIDLANPQRVLRALEVFLLSGRSFTSFKLAAPKERPFAIEKICLTRPREELYRRIDRRVLQMVEDGLVEEVRGLLPLRDCTALKTVGYREIFDWLDHEAGSGRPGLPCSLDEAVARIQVNTRHYAKKQITWWRRDPEVRFVEVQRFER